jgi:tRNA pseudouridine55 synthase
MRGVVNLDKPVGPTSHDMVGLLRRLTGTRRIGHAGTLDPLASGVLPVLVGAATRFSEELTGGAKRYRATIRLGARSATDDGEGPITPTGVAPPGRPEIESELRRFVGTFDQRPPAFSARKVGGRTAHRAARAGAPIEVAPRRVTVHAIDVIGVVGPETGEGTTDVDVDVRCAAGTYIRSIARDLGDALGCGGYLASLRRTEAAGLRVEDALTPDALEELVGAGRLGEAILPVEQLLPLRRVDLGDDRARRFTHGSSVPVDDVADGRVAAMGGGRLLGVGTVAGGILQPEKVMPQDAPA